MGLLRPDDSRDIGWIAMRCKNHPNLRWTRKDPEAMRGAISQNMQLMFDGDQSQPEAPTHVFDPAGERLSPEIKAEYVAKGFVFECPCPYSDLEFIHVQSRPGDKNPKDVILEVQQDILRTLSVGNEQ